MRTAFNAHVEEMGGKKKLALDSSAYFRHAVNQLKVGQKLTITLDLKHPVRSMRQHRFYFAYLELITDKIYQGDVLKVLKTFPNESIDCIITSPPYYGLRDYGVEGQIGLELSEEYIKIAKERTYPKNAVYLTSPRFLLEWKHVSSWKRRFFGGVSCFQEYKHRALLCSKKRSFIGAARVTR